MDLQLQNYTFLSAKYSSFREIFSLLQIYTWLQENIGMLFEITDFHG